MSTFCQSIVLPQQLLSNHSTNCGLYTLKLTNLGPYSQHTYTQYLLINGKLHGTGRSDYKQTVFPKGFGLHCTSSGDDKIRLH